MNDFEDLEKKLKESGQKTTPHIDKRILDDAFAVLEQTPRLKQKPTEKIPITS